MINFTPFSLDFSARSLCKFFALNVVQFGRQKAGNEKPNSEKIRKLVAKKTKPTLAGVSKIELSVSKR